MNIRTRARALPLLTGGLLTAVLAAGCSNGLETSAAGAEPSVTQASAAVPSSATSPTPTPAEPSTSASPTPAPTLRSTEPSTPPAPQSTEAAPPSGSARPTSSASTSTAGARCTLADLAVGVRTSEGGAAAGSNYVLLTFENTGDATCTLTGYPGVSFVGKGNGTQLGVPAVRNPTAPATAVRLAEGRSTTALLQIVNAGNYDADACAPSTSDGFRVYPPGSRSAAYVPFRTQACQRDPGQSEQLSVSPVGTGG